MSSFLGQNFYQDNDQPDISDLHEISAEGQD